MKVFIAGGTGFIGRRLSEFFLEKGYRVTVSGTRSTPWKSPSHGFQYIPADLTREGPWQSVLSDSTIVINLVGKSIFHRWSDSYKREILSSRILTTRNIVDAIQPKDQTTLISTSAIGYYGDRGDDLLNEEEHPGNDFLSEVALLWEEEAKKGEEKGVRVICPRFGVVFGETGGAVEKMVFPFKWFFGGPQGKGSQWLSWIHLDDLCLAMEFVIRNKSLRGPLNFCSPYPIQNKELSKLFGKILNRPSWIPTPGWVIRLAFGELGGTILSSQRCMPTRLLKEGYEFTYPDPEEAIRKSLRK
ncbi:MAG: TIGR01777 family oxidoreductase [Thermodesulfobacteriota bacterium]